MLNVRKMAFVPQSFFVSTLTPSEKSCHQSKTNLNWKNSSFQSPLSTPRRPRHKHSKPIQSVIVPLLPPSTSKSRSKSKSKKQSTSATTKLPRRSDHDHSPETYGFLHIATITSTHGVYGHLKAQSNTDFPKHRLSPTTDDKYLLLPGRRYPRPVTLLSSRPASRSNTWILHLSHVNQPEDFKRLRLSGARLYVRGVDKPPLSRGEFVAADLVDLKVCLLLSSEEEEEELGVGYTAVTRNRGEIKGSLPFGIVEEIIPREVVSASKLANDILQVALFDININSVEIPEDAKRVLVPFVKEIVPVVDLDKGLIIINPPQGLLDIAVVNKVSKPIRPRALLMPSSVKTQL